MLYVKEPVYLGNSFDTESIRLGQGIEQDHVVITDVDANRVNNEFNSITNKVDLKEDEIPLEIGKYLEDLKPDIVVITGHDVFYKKNGKISDINSYKNSKNFANAVKEARNYEKSHDKLIIIAGACQSDYEELIKAGANFASSPKRVNLHALDPAIIASSIALSDKSKPIDLLKIIDKTKYKEEGIGGIITNGTMYTGYPR